MIAMISGQVVSSRGHCLVLKTGDFAFEVKTTPQLLVSAERGKSLELHTRMHVREDEISLYGFETADELKVFDLLCSVSGIGPKIALGAIGAIGAAELARAITMGDETSLISTPGIGPKTAKLVLLTLSGKLSLENEAASGPNSTVVDALASLGVAAAEAQKLVSAATQNLGRDADSAAMLKEALRLRRA